MNPDRLKKIRLEKDLKQKDMYTQLHIDKSTYSKYENGKLKPSVDVLEKICKILDISADYLLGNIDVPLNLHEMEFLHDLEKGKDDKTLIDKYIFELGEYDLTEEEMKKMLKIIRALNED